MLLRGDLTFDATVALAPSIFSSDNGDSEINLPNSGPFPSSTITVQAGDVIEGTVTFTGGRLLTQGTPSLTYFDLALLFSPPSLPASVMYNGSYTIALLGIAGTPPPANAVVSSGTFSDEFIHESYSASGPFDFSITGFTYTIDVSSRHRLVERPHFGHCFARAVEHCFKQALDSSGA